MKLGQGRTLIALHALPGSSRQIEDLVRCIPDRPVIAPDLAGLGDSDSNGIAHPAIADYAADLVALIDSLGEDKVDLYGSHTGACLAIEAAIMAPSRVNRIILDGVPIFTPEEVTEYVANYAPDVKPDINGMHLLWAHNFCKDQILFWPWYDKSAKAARGAGLPPAEHLHPWVLEVIKGRDGIPPGYRAAFHYPTLARLPLVAQPVLCISAVDDTLAEPSRRAADLLPNATLHRIESEGGPMAPPALVARAIEDFLG